MAFRYIQTFYLDSSVVKNAPEASISGIGLYFRAKPNFVKNKSGIQGPGVEVSIVPCVSGIPQIQELSTYRPPEPTEHGARFQPRFEIARKEWGEIVPSADASVETKFMFDEPIQLKTKTEYGIIIKYDGAEDFVLWYSKQGQTLVGSTQKSPGVSSKYVQSLYTYIGAQNININNLTSNTTNSSDAAVLNTQSNAVPPTLTPDSKYLQNNWKPLSDTDLKFKVYAARYFHNGVAVVSNNTIKSNPAFVNRFDTDFLPTQISTNVTRLTAPSIPQEYIRFDTNLSTFKYVQAGDLVYQTQPYYPANEKTKLTVTTADGNNIITANPYSFSNGVTFNNANGFNNLFTKSTADDEYIIIDHGDYVDVRKVMSIISNTSISVDRPIPITNSSAKIYKSPVGMLAGINDTYVDGQDSQILILSRTNANSSLRFVNNTILSANITVGGTGFSNTDYVTISGFENTTSIKGGYSAKLLLTTNSTGGIVNTYVANTGCGFVYPSRLIGSNVVFSNSSGGSSAGTGATLSFNIGSQFRCEKEPSTEFVNATVINLEASRLKPEITLNNPLGSSFVVKHRSLFYGTGDASNYDKKAYYLYDNPSSTDISVKIFKSHDTGKEQGYTSVIPSRSNQFVIPYANGSVANTTVLGNNYSNAAVYLFDVSSNNDYTLPYIEPEIVHSHYSKYVINNDYTNENTNYGNAYAKHVTTKINFNKDRSAEDLLVYLTAYRPAGTDFKVFARIHNNKDEDAFDDKDWTLLEETDSVGVYSSSIDSSDFIELTYNFRDTANSTLLTGSVTVDNTTTTTITGSGTAFTTDLVSNDLVKITNPLFSSNSFAFCVVNTVTNNISFTIDNAISNTGLVGSGMQISKVNYKYQAFNNLLNSNIVQYFNSSMAQYENYDNLQLKVVMLSTSDSIIPKIDDIRGAGVSA